MFVIFFFLLNLYISYMSSVLHVVGVSVDLVYKNIYKLLLTFCLNHHNIRIIQNRKTAASKFFFVKYLGKYFSGFKIKKR